jgi:YrbI family 3-deoxy-D-manno-octulosonate 8-phosphate phosphatase
MNFDLTHDIISKAKNIKLLLTDCDGVLTDAGVYYSSKGEEMKRFSLRDGMGVERLRKINIETGIITGENSLIVNIRARKLNINECHCGVKDKYSKFLEIIERKKINPAHVAYMGDDINDLEIMKHVGISACPSDAYSGIIEIADIKVDNKGGHGAFRDFAEILIECRLK